MSTLRTYLLLCVPYTFLVRRFWFTADDAYISFRFSKNLAAGHGLRYNLGDHTPVEGYSNFLWVLVCSVFERLHLDMAFWPPLVSAACGYVLLWLVLDRMIRRLDVEPLPAGLGALTLAAFPSFAVWSTSGLATMPFALLVFLTFDRLVLRERPDGLGGGLAALGLALIRVEGIAWCAVLFVVAAIVHRRTLRPLLGAAGILVAGFAVYSGWRLAHHGHLLANTAQAKLGPSVLLEGWLRGGRYVMTHFLTFLTPFLMIPATILALRRKRRAKGIPVALMAWAFPAYGVAVTGDYMAMGRFLVPALAFQAVLFGWMIQDLSRRAVVRAAAAAAMVIVAALPGWDRHLVPDSVRERVLFRHAWRFRSEYAYWQSLKDHVTLWTEKGLALRRYAEKHPFRNEPPWCVTGPLGCIGYRSGLNMLDRAGLVTRFVTSSEHHLAPTEALPGHDRVVSALTFAALDPEILKADLLTTSHPDSVRRKCRNTMGGMGTQKEVPDLADRYVVDFADVTDPERPERPLVLVTWRRIEDGGPDAAWATFRARLDSLGAAARDRGRSGTR